MKRFLCAILGIFLCLPASAWAVANITASGTTYQTTQPTGSDWTNGWATTVGTTGITGWNYVGTINGASGVYLGDGWVLTAAHVSPSIGSTFTLSNIHYTVSAVSAFGTPDLVLFKISTISSLPSLTLTGTQSLLTAFSAQNAGSSVVMLGYGGGSESWGVNTVTALDQTVVIAPHTTTDFQTALGTTTFGFGHNRTSITNTAQVVGGDSGGADFYFDADTGKWVLVGINEVAYTYTGTGAYAASGMVDLSQYADQISTTTGIEVVPEPSTWALLGTGGALFLWARLHKSALAQKAKRSPV